MAEVATARSLSSWTVGSNLTNPPTAGAVASTTLAAVGSAAALGGGGGANASIAAALSSAVEVPLRTTFLGAFTVVAFVGNLLLILAIAQSRTLRTTAINVHLMGMAAANFVFCAVDMPLMIASSVSEAWQYGETACSVFSFLRITPSVEYVLGILCLAADRLAVARSPRGGGRSDPAAGFGRAAALVVGCWLVAAATGVPLLTRSVPSAWHYNSYSCDVGVGDVASLVYSAVVYSCLFSLPPLLTVLLLMMTASAALRDREDTPRHAPPPPRSTGWSAASAEAAAADPRGARGAVFVLLLFVLWIIFVAPHTALASVELYSQSTEDRVGGSGLSPQSSHVLGVVFAWLACAHNMVLPFAAFVWRRDIWHNFKDVLTWHKSSTAVGVASIAAAARVRGQGQASLDGGSQSSAAMAPPERFPARFKVPVLVATETGLHVHDDANNNAAADEEERSGAAAAAAADAYDDRQVFYADLTTRSNEITIDRGRGGTVASTGSDQADELDVGRFALPSRPAAEAGGAASRWPPLCSAAAAAEVSAGQANSLSTDSGVGSTAGSAGRNSKKRAGKARARGPLLVRTGSQPPAESERGAAAAAGGDPLPRTLLPALSLSGKGPWLTPAQINELSSPAYAPQPRSRREAGAGLEGDAPAAPRGPSSPHLGWAAVAEDEETEDAARPRRQRKKKRAKREAAVTQAAALINYGGSDANAPPPLRPAGRLVPIPMASMPAAAVAMDAAYGSPSAEHGLRAVHAVAEEGF